MIERNILNSSRKSNDLEVGQIPPSSLRTSVMMVMDFVVASGGNQFSELVIKSTRSAGAGLAQ